jgi:hypothetical protein
MSSDKSESLADIWAARYDDRDDEDLVSDRWALRLAMRDQAMAQPFRNFQALEEGAPEVGPPEAVDDAAHPAGQS